jgi:hypothetical protein
MSASDLVDWLGLNHPSHQVRPSTLPVSYFKFPPSSDPVTVPPPPTSHAEPRLFQPFPIDTKLYNDLLKPQVPITIALVYMSLVSVFNQVNARRNHKPWAISRTRVFKLLVIFHNVFLAAYSAWTFVGMFHALRQSLPEIDEDWKVSKTVDALCKLHGPRGVGNAATYNATTSAWGMTNRLLHLAADGLAPETTDVGRIWNEGLAFYGWLFYLSKFYEVVDTMIILLKGRKSSLLQTYHHAGAMISMWAGIRYMSPPIWMFVFVNSGIHAVMYTFYLLSTLRVKVPKWFKRTLTTIQITQFVVGASYAFLHLFVAYQRPVSVPYLYHLGGVATRVASEAPSVTSSIATAIATAANYGAWLKKAVLRGAGYEGLAENVLNDQGRTFGVDAVHIIEDTVRREETRYRDELQWVHCLDTSGQVFAILLNCVYLAPLTFLFLQFFITSYVKQFERRRSRTASDAAMVAGNSFLDASKGVSRRLSEAVQEMHNISEDIGDELVFVDGEEVKQEMKKAAEQAKQAIQKGSEKVKQSAKNSGVSPEAVKEEFQRDMKAARKTLQDTAEKVKGAAAQVGDSQTQEKISAKAQELKESASDVVEKAAETVKSAVGSAKEQAKPAANAVSEKASELKDQAGPTVDAAANKAAELKDRAVESAKSAAGQASKAGSEAAEKSKAASEKAAEDAKENTEKAANNAKDSANKTSAEAKDTAQKAEEKTKDNAKKANESPKKKPPKLRDAAKAAADDTNQRSPKSPTKSDNSASKDRASEDKSKSSDADKAQESSSSASSQPETKSPNENGTRAGEGSGPSGKQSETSASPKKSEASAEESEQKKAEKKEEDKIIDESQVVRDEDVKTETSASAESDANGAGQGGKPSFADMVKKEAEEDGGEADKSGQETSEEKKEDKDEEGWSI